MVLPAVETAAGRTASPHGHPESERLTEVLTPVVCFMLGPDWVCPHPRLGSSIHYGRGCRLVVGTRRHSGAFSIVSSGDRLGRRFHLNLLRFWSIGHGLLIRTYLRCATLSASVSRISQIFDAQSPRTTQAASCERMEHSETNSCKAPCVVLSYQGSATAKPTS